MKISIEGPIASPLFFKYLVDESKSIQASVKTMTIVVKKEKK